MVAKVGRPAHGPELKRSPMNMKTTATLRARIEEAARHSGLSMSQEVERRLERSFRDDDVVEAIRSRLFAGLLPDPPST